MSGKIYQYLTDDHTRLNDLLAMNKKLSLDELWELCGKDVSWTTAGSSHLHAWTTPSGKRLTNAIYAKPIFRDQKDIWAAQ